MVRLSGGHGAAPKHPTAIGGGCVKPGLAGHLWPLPAGTLDYCYLHSIFHNGANISILHRADVEIDSWLSHFPGSCGYSTAKSGLSPRPEGHFHRGAGSLSPL